MFSAELALVVLAGLLTYALHSTVLLGGVWLAKGRLKSERAKQALWKTALVGGVVTAGLQLGLGYEPFGGRFALDREAVAVGPEPDSTRDSTRDSTPDSTPDSAPDSTHGSAHEPAHELGFVPAERGLTRAFHAPENHGIGTNTFAVEGTAEYAEEPALQAESASLGVLKKIEPSRVRWGQWALFAWFAIGAALLLLCIVAWMRLRDHLGGRRPVEDGALPGLLALLRRRAGILRQVRLTTSPKLEGPIAMGVLFPQICVPPRALNELSTEMQQSMLAHELAHIVRFDPLWLTICRALETVFFFQPLNRVARKELEKSAEFLCDEWAVAHTKDRISLARCLTEVAAWMIGEPRALAGCRMAKLTSPLGERVERILETDLTVSRKPRWVVPFGAGIVAATAILAPGFASATATSPSGSVPVPEPPEVPEFPKSPEFTAPATASPTSTQPSTASASPENLSARVLETTNALGDDLEVLESELERIRAKFELREVPEQLEQRFTEIERRTREVRALKHRIQQLIAGAQR